MSESLKIGQIIEAGREETRDAIHCAVAPVVADCRLEPGTFVSISGSGVTPCAAEYATGIVDPFLTRFVNPGERFWLFLKPGSITSLRHSWTHPAFEKTPEPPNEKAEAEKWLRAWLEASGEDVTYNLLIDVCDNGSQYTAQGHDLHLGIPDEVWEKVEIVTGQKYDKSHRDDTYFSCSC